MLAFLSILTLLRMARPHLPESKETHMVIYPRP
jgi:hypothetical protein